MNPIQNKALAISTWNQVEELESSFSCLPGTICIIRHVDDRSGIKVRRMPAYHYGRGSLTGDTFIAKVVVMGIREYRKCVIQVIITPKSHDRPGESSEVALKK